MSLASVTIELLSLRCGCSIRGRVWLVWAWGVIYSWLADGAIDLWTHSIGTTSMANLCVSRRCQGCCILGSSLGVVWGLTEDSMRLEEWGWGTRRLEVLSRLIGRRSSGRGWRGCGRAGWILRLWVLLEGYMQLVGTLTSSTCRRCNFSIWSRDDGFNVRR